MDGCLHVRTYYISAAVCSVLDELREVQQGLSRQEGRGRARNGVAPASPGLHAEIW
jgi:hypothetical protein